VDARALREIYLAGFKRALDRGKPWAVMSSYNLLNGVRVSQNAWLLTTVLREEWGYDGLVVSDWYGIRDRPASLAAGNDLSMPERKKEKAGLADAVRSGQIPESVLDASCLRMIRLARRIASGRRSGVKADYDAHHRLAQDIAAESIVLLKNERGVLPFTPEKARRIAVIGLPAQEPVVQGSGCSTTVPYMWDIPLDEIYQLAGGDIAVDYAVGAPDGYAIDPLQEQRAVDAAAAADAAVVFVSTGVGEDGESGDRANLDILPAHAALIRAVGEKQPNTVVVVANGDAVVMPWQGSAAAILETFYGGQGMGGAVARILFGKANPCGKLSVSFPASLEGTPGHLAYPGENYRHRYAEGLHVGYRYYDALGIEPAYPFGFGLGYSRFDYADLRLSRSRLEHGESLEATLDVTNAGALSGKEIVQLYVAPPPGRYRRERQALKAFCKVALRAGETRSATLRLEWTDFAHFDPERGKWLVDPGEYGIRIGKSSRDIVLEQTLFVNARNMPPLIREESMAALLLENPPVLDRVARLVADKTGSDAVHVRAWLERMAPTFFTGLYTTLSETMNLDISRAELAGALADQE
jgi:beta-glucosidase